ncbi:helix-turn-helix transcriptional regulator [Streptomyces ziwulingensis]
MQKTSSRLLTLLSLLQTPRDWSGDDLAGRLGITARTVRRDIGRLRELGYPIRALKGPSGGYRLAAGSRLPPLLFDDGQAVALALALRAAAADPALGEDAARALATVRQVLPPRLRQRVDMLRITAVPPPGTAPAAPSSSAPAAPSSPAAPVGTRLLAELGRVVRAREELRFDYCGPDTDGPAGPPRRTQPHHLLTWHGRWYVIAWDLDRADWRTFRVDRMRPRVPTGRRFTPRALPGRDVAAFVTGRFRGTDGTGTDWPCRGEVVLGLPGRAVAPFAPDGVVEELGPDRCRLTLGSWSWTGLAAALGRFDTDIQVIGPPELADAFTMLAARYAKAGAGGGTGAGGGGGTRPGPPRRRR